MFGAISVHVVLMMIIKRRECLHLVPLTVHALILMAGVEASRIYLQLVVAYWSELLFQFDIATLVL